MDLELAGVEVSDLGVADLDDQNRGAQNGEERPDFGGEVIWGLAGGATLFKYTAELIVMNNLLIFIIFIIFPTFRILLKTPLKKTPGADCRFNGRNCTLFFQKSYFFLLF